MVRSAAAVIVVILMAVAPTVRAICDAGCLRTTVTAHHGETSPPPPSSHCATTDSFVPAAPAGDCGHDHGAPDLVLAAAKPTAGPSGALAIVAAASPVAVVGLEPLRLTPLSRVRPPAPPPTRPRPLRI